ncbi:hypothetical protein [Streptomyces sp. NPDC003077]|uniref:DUF6891 domain-containing protein n=1 Tax=Streptomyces sp. NPDC003077 TaxID=3154443 RepID=UPI0033B38899
MLPITVKTESGPDLTRPSAAELTALLCRIGAADDHFVVAERIPEEAHEFLQTWREEDGSYEVEHRDGAPDRHFRLELTDPAEVAALFLAWARGEKSWRTAHAWERVELTAAPELDPEARTELEERVRLLLRTGFWSLPALAEAMTEEVEDEYGDESSRDVHRMVAALWEERLAEEADWPDVTDVDRVARAFAALEAEGITARMNFTCCATCAHGEICAERREGDRGYAFFHQQDTEGAADGHGLYIRFGAYPDPISAGEPDRISASKPDAIRTGKPDLISAGETERTERTERAEKAERAEETDGGTEGVIDEEIGAVGRAVADALEGVGLTVEWDGDPRRAIHLPSLDWRRRLPMVV